MPLTLGLCACGDGPDAGAQPTGTIAGKVVAEHAGGTDVVAGAVVSIENGPSTTTDPHGDFVLEGVAPDSAVIVEVRGPRAGDAAHPLVYGSFSTEVEVVEDEIANVTPVLVPGCERMLDAAAGGTLDVASCGGAGRAELVFPPDSLVYEADNAPFDGLARVELAINDPGAEAQFLALPSPSDELSDGETYGAIEVRLRDALNGAALQVASGASVEVSVEVTGTIMSAPPDFGVRVFDRTQREWVTEPDGTIETRDGRTFYRFDATHFSQRAVASFHGPIQSSCINYTYSGGTPHTIQIRSGGRWWIQQAFGACVLAWPNSLVQVRVIALGSLQGGLGALSPWETVTTGAQMDNACGGGPGCASTHLSIGPEGCIRGRYQSLDRRCVPNGPNVPGILYFSRDWYTFHTERVANICDASFGTAAIGLGNSLVVPPGNGPVRIADQTGSFRNWTPSFSGNLGCDDIGTQAATGIGVHSSFVSRVVRNVASGRSYAADPGSTYTANLDGSASSGTIHTYSWDVFSVVDGDETLVWSHTSANATSSLRVDAGRYRIRLRVFAGVSVVAEESELKDIPGPTASFTMSPTPPSVDQQVLFDASASAGNVVAYEWDFNGAREFDATGVTADHVYTAEGPRQARLRITDDSGAIDESVVSFTVQGDLPANTIRMTIVGDGYVTQQGGAFRCDGPATCQQTFAGPAFLEAYNADDTPNQSAWGSIPNADGYQAYFPFSMGESYDLTVTF